MATKKKYKTSVRRNAQVDDLIAALTRLAAIHEAEAKRKAKHDKMMDDMFEQILPQLLPVLLSQLGVKLKSHLQPVS